MDNFKVRNLRMSNPDKLLETMKVSRVLHITKFVGEFGFVVMNGVVPNCRSMKHMGVLNAAVSVSKNSSSMKESREITITKGNNYQFSRFLIAYMFADYQLHYDENDLPFVSGIFEESIYDKETYHYALDILLPNVLFKDENMDFSNRSYLANKYQVSEYLLWQKILWFQEMNKQKVLKKELEG